MTTDGYRPVSSLAVAAVATGALSIVSLLGPAFWVVPLVGVALAIAALREIGREGSVKVGRLPALLGLALAVGFGMQSVSHRLVGDWFDRARAETAAFEFVRAVRESRFTDARDMCGPTALPVRESVRGLPAGQQPSDRDGPSAASAFASQPAVALLAQCPGPTEATMAPEPSPENFPGSHAFLVTVPCGPDDRPGEAAGARVRIVVAVDPSDRSPGVERWWVVQHDVVAPIGRPVE